MLLLHLSDPAGACGQFVAATAPGGCLIIQDADFGPVALEAATEEEAAGLAVMNDTMRAAGVHLALGPQLETMTRAAGAQLVQVESRDTPARGGEGTALLTAMTLERFRDQAVAAGASSHAIDAAIGALNDPERHFTGPTQWSVRCQVPDQFA